MREGLALTAKNRTLKVINFMEIVEQTQVNLNIDIHNLRSIAELTDNSVVHCGYLSDKIFVTRRAVQS
jgi:hypothetical protein